MENKENYYQKELQYNKPYFYRSFSRHLQHLSGCVFYFY